MMLKGLAMSYRSTVYQLVDSITEEQMNEIINKAKSLIAIVECEETDGTKS